MKRGNSQANSKAFQLTTSDMPGFAASERLVALETTVAHLEHELGEMHSVLLALQAELRASREHVSKLERRLIVAIEVQEERDPMDERPPHY